MHEKKSKWVFQKYYYLNDHPEHKVTKIAATVSNEQEKTLITSKWEK